MKYWGYLVAKLIAAGIVLAGLWLVMLQLLPAPQTFRNVMTPFSHDLPYTFGVMLMTLIGVGLIWAAVWDQRYRCRTCLRKLRMPIVTGSWTHLFLGGHPKTEYICPYGHGTLKVDEVQIAGHEQPNWQPHEDIWKELEHIHESEK